MSFDALRVLLVEDHPGDAILVHRELSRVMPQARIDTASTMAAAAAHLAARRHDVVLLDLGLPDSVGLDGVRRLVNEFPSVPVVVLTGDERSEQGLEAVAVGAHDFHVKGHVDGSRIALSLRYAVQRNDTQQALATRSEALRRANERLSAFARSTAHDLKAPLVNVLHLVDLLERGVADDRVVERLRRNADHSLRLIDGHLQKGTVDDHAGDRHGPVDLARLVGEIVEVLDIHRAEIRVEPLPIVGGRAGGLRGVLQNLIANAVHHGRDDSGHATVEVSARPVPDGWIVSVEDAGPGVAPDLADTLFEPGSRRVDSGGHGLGLAGVRTTLEAAGQVIWMEPSLLGGAAFRFTAPPVSSVVPTARTA